MSEDLTKKLSQTDSEKLTLILNRVDKLEQTVDERLHDTRPIWEKVVADIATLQEGQDLLRAEVGEIKKSMRGSYYRFDVLNNTMLAIRADQQEIFDRVRVLENSHHPPNAKT
jgi:hypothetical protein